MPPGLFGWQTRFEQLDNSGDPLVKLNQIVNWQRFRQTLETLRDKERKPFDVRLMFKIHDPCLSTTSLVISLSFRLGLAFLFSAFWP